MSLCACGCDTRVEGRGPRAIYATDACKVRACKRRRRVAALTVLETGEQPFPAMPPTSKRVLKALVAVGGIGATTRELCQPDVGGVRFGGRIHELRGLGYRIDTRRERNGSNRYWLRDSPALHRLFDVTTPTRRAA